MYDKPMKSDIFPLAMPETLLGEVRSTAKKTGLSMADVMRQSVKLGLPALVRELAGQELKPFTKAEARQCWEEPNDEFDALEQHCASNPLPLVEIRSDTAQRP
jgi:hypothetical protein